MSLYSRAKAILSGKGLGRIPGVTAACRVLDHHLDRNKRMRKQEGVVLVSCQGNQMYVDARDIGIASSLLTRGCYEEYETELFRRSIGPGMIVVDVGANIGYYTLIAAKETGEGGKVYAFEPESHNYELLVKNIDANGYRNVVPIRKAVSNRTGCAKLFLDKINLGAHSFAEDNLVPGNAIGRSGILEVETVALDHFIPDGRVDIIKIDTQGAEGLVLEGARNILRTSSNLKIFMEFWPAGLRSVGSDPLPLLNEVQDYGFKIRLIDEKRRLTEDVELDKVLELCQEPAKGRWGHVNLLMEKTNR